ncbi:NAD-dependent epimerase/dehydratase family protein [Allokutzneria oryzae]|uniref:NAD-dependent epimerase/dehydratase family protein n=1 Tax=Allokutzneria oryzae TaxID=1378989 RepID=A0ABV6A6Q8_9PSEU
MRLLVLGGTGFVGRVAVSEAVARGWSVTVFNRGHGDPPPPGARVLLGDRTTPEGLAALAGEWDAVIDTWSAEASAVRTAATALFGRVDHFVYVSSRSVYQDLTMEEDGALVNPAAPGYAAHKVGGELAARDVFGERVLLARAGLVLGPHENVGRLPWWLNRIAAGGVVPAPAPPELGLQFIDVRDLAIWLLDHAALRTSGAYNLVSEPGHTTMGELLEACRAVTGSPAQLRWIAPERILDAGVQPWNDLPIWIPEGHEARAMHEVVPRRALALGMRCRPAQDTVADTWRWLTDIGGTAPQRMDRAPVGLSPLLESRLLATG